MEVTYKYYCFIISVLFVFYSGGHGLCLANSGIATVRYCPEGWVRYKQEKCFKKFDTMLNHHSAEQDCEGQDATLASISSADEHQFLLSYIVRGVSSDNLTNFWTGGMKKGSFWFWTDLTPFNYIQWWPGHPVLEEGECVWLVMSTEFMKTNPTSWGRMAVRDCNHSVQYICQKYQTESRQLIFVRSGDNLVSIK